MLAFVMIGDCLDVNEGLPLAFDLEPSLLRSIFHQTMEQHHLVYILLLLVLDAMRKSQMVLDFSGSGFWFCEFTVISRTIGYKLFLKIH
jgi:hypothetical protein